MNDSFLCHWNWPLDPGSLATQCLCNQSNQAEPKHGVCVLWRLTSQLLNSLASSVSCYVTGLFSNNVPLLLSFKPRLATESQRCSTSGFSTSWPHHLTACMGDYPKKDHPRKNKQWGARGLLLTSKPTTTERIRASDWRGSKRKTQRWSDLWLAPRPVKGFIVVCMCRTKWRLSVYQVKQESLRQPWSRSGLGRVGTSHFFHWQTADLNIGCRFWSQFSEVWEEMTDNGMHNYHTLNTMLWLDMLFLL